MASCFILLIAAVQYTPFASPKQNAEKWYASFLFLGVMTIVFRDSLVSMWIKDILLFYIHPIAPSSVIRTRTNF